MNSPKKIIIVDDSDDNLYLLKYTLELEGYEVIDESVRTTVEQVKEVQPNLIILDLGLPEKKGDAICVDIKNDPDTAHVPVILLSTKLEFKDLAQKCKADAFIEKPYDIYQLANLVKEHIL